MNALVYENVNYLINFYFYKHFFLSKNCSNFLANLFSGIKFFTISNLKGQYINSHKSKNLFTPEQNMKNGKILTFEKFSSP